MSRDRRKIDNHALRRLVMAGNMLELEILRVAEESSDRPMSEADRQRLQTLQESWRTALESLREETVPLRIVADGGRQGFGRF